MTTPPNMTADEIKIRAIKSGISNTYWLSPSMANYAEEISEIIDFAQAIEAARDAQWVEYLKAKSDEPIGYLAHRDGKPSWGEDCVCRDPVYPVDEHDDRVSVAIYTTAQPVQEPQRIPHCEAGPDYCPHCYAESKLKEKNNGANN